MGLREEHKQLTRRKVLGAVLELLAEGSLDELSVPAVARRSGVSLATIYRYYPNKNDLLDAAAAEPSRLALEGEHVLRAGDDELAGFQRMMWHEFAGNLPLLRYQITSAAGRDMRHVRLERSRRQLAGYIEQHGVDPMSAEGERLIAVLLLVSGSLALVELHDRQGLEVDSAIDTSLWAAGVLIDASRPVSQAPPHQPLSRKRSSGKPSSRGAPA